MIKKCMFLSALVSLTGAASAITVSSGPQDPAQVSVTPSGFFEQFYINWEVGACAGIPACTSFFGSYPGTAAFVGADQVQSFDVLTDKRMTSVYLFINSEWDADGEPLPAKRYRWTATDLNTGKLLLDETPGENDGSFIQLSSVGTNHLRLTQYSLVPVVPYPEPGYAVRSIYNAGLVVAVVPEPATCALMLTGLVGVIGASRTARRTRDA